MPIPIYLRDGHIRLSVNPRVKYGVYDNEGKILKVFDLRTDALGWKRANGRMDWTIKEV